MIRHDLTCDDVRDLAGLYVLDALEADEAAGVRDHLATCGQPHPEIAELGGVVGYLAELPEPLEPRPVVRERLMAAIEAERSGSREAERSRRPEPATDPRPGSGVVAAAAPRLRVAPRRWAWVLAAAAVVAIVAGAGWGLALQGQLDSSRAQVALLGRALAATTQSGTVTASVAGTGTASDIGGFVVVPPTGPRYLVVSGLVPAPAGKTYQAWFIQGGTAVSAGTFQVAGDGATVWDGMTAPGAADTFALTVELPGAQQPTMQPLALATLRH